MLKCFLGSTRTRLISSRCHKSGNLNMMNHTKHLDININFSPERIVLVGLWYLKFLVVNL